MRFWRICRRRCAAQAAGGEGARLFGGRWNNREVRVVYASTSLALAAVETFVNLEPNLGDESLHRFGDEWIRRGMSAGLLVPSAAIRGDRNVLLNPHPEPFEFDARMFR